MKRAEESFYATFCLRDTGGFKIHAKLLAGITELCKCIILQRRGIFLSVLKDSTSVSVKHVGDPIAGEYLPENMIVPGKGFLFVEPCSCDHACGIVYGGM